MDLPLIFHGLTKPAASIWSASAFRPALIIAAATAGYVIFMPFASKTATDAVTEEPQWAGNIERPDVQTPAQSEPITSASYVVPEAILTGSVAKKTGATTPKVASKPVTPPRKPQSIEEASKTIPPASAMIVPAAAIPVGALPPEALPPEAIPPRGEASARPRNLLARVTDRLPPRGMLLKPFHVVGDAFHNLMGSF